MIIPRGLKVGETFTSDDGKTYVIDFVGNPAGYRFHEVTGATKETKKEPEAVEPDKEIEAEPVQESFIDTPPIAKKKRKAK